jgi:chorismate synthase
MASRTDATLTIQGRHDPCILSRATVVVEAATALSIMEAMI